MQHAGRNYKASILGVPTCPTPLEQHSKRESYDGYELFWNTRERNNITVQAKNNIMYSNETLHI